MIIYRYYYIICIRIFENDLLIMINGKFINSIQFKMLSYTYLYKSRCCIFNDIIYMHIYTYDFKDSFPSQLGASCKLITERWFLIKKAQTQIVR